MPTIYIADDDSNIRMLIKSFLVKEGFTVLCFENGQDLLLEFEENPPDLIILDIMMPVLDGLSACAIIRQKSNVPIIIVSAKDSEIDRVSGITIGGDDYLVKPFSGLELVARVKALFRRAQMSKQNNNTENKIFYNDLELDINLRTTTLGGKPFAVTPTEFDFLVYMVQNKARAVSKSELLKTLWEFDFDVDTRATDDLVKRLRRKMKEQNSSVSVQTVWGFGYRLSLGEENK